uniref:Pleckstrin homology and RhoGEF domain containing G3 n=1 Tax=Neovison vison TaxID=452646 RepID=A0A8C7EMZ1_NEOVI
MPVSASLRQDGSQERPVSLTSSTSSSGSSRDSRGAMEEPSGSGASAENGAGSPRGRHPPNGNTSSSSWLSGRGPLSPFGGRAPAAPVHKLSYLGRVVREIVETERMYVQDLRSIVESQEFDIYTQYCNNYPNSVAALTECMRDKQQAKFFRERQELLQHSLPLGSYLLKPVQRILKYHLLLQEIAKHFDEEEDGFEVVEDAIDTMTCVAWYINDMKRRHEHAVRLQEIQSLLINWKGPDLTIYGELVLEGTFRVHRVRNERTFFLFDKALLITKKRGDHFVYKGHIPCSSLMLIESTRDSLCFTVTHYKHSKQQYNIQAKTAEEKRSWTHHIKRLILENHHTTIPQKAKEAILEMDSYYPSRYRCSPERLKKAWSSQDEVSTHARQGRRQSEPTRHLLRQLSEKARAAGMKEKGRRESEGPQSCRRSSSRSPTSAEKCVSFESTSPRLEVEPDPEPELEQEVFVAMEVPSIEEMPSDTESPEVLETQLGAHQELLGLEPPGDMVGFVVAESTEDLKALSSEEEEDMGPTLDTESLLPPSVLDQASVIAERFASSFSRRSSLALEDGKASGFGSPRLASRSSSVLSLEGSDKGPAWPGSTTDALSSQPPPDSTVGVATDSGPSVNGLEPSSPGCPAEPDRPSCKRKASTLSTRDRLLLDKIKSYYESAEHRDAGFSVRRRESLSYIPKGLVRNSVSRFNSLPRPDPEPMALPGHKRQVGSQPPSWALCDLPGAGQASAGESAPITDAEFRPSSEIVKIWEGMESSRESSLQGPGQGQANGFDLHEPLFILEEHELGAITEESATASPESASPTEQPSPAHLARELKELVKELSSSVQGELVTPLHPRIVQLSHVMDGPMSERVKNKVYQLARQYSLRIKSKSVTGRPPLQWGKAAPTIPCLQEEAGAPSGSRGKRKPVLSLLSDEQMVAQEHSPPKPGSPRHFSFSPTTASPRTTSPGARPSSRSPLSPFDTETFTWPDVRELCSKYASHDEAFQAEGSRHRGPPVNRSRSAPENMVEPPLAGRVGRCCSVGARRGQGGPEAAQLEPPGRLPQSRPVGEEALYVTADLTLENNRRVIVMEKAPPPRSVGGLEEGSGQRPHTPVATVGQGLDFQESGISRSPEYWQKEEGPRDPADPGQQGRVRNLREKFQALNSVG